LTALKNKQVNGTVVRSWVKWLYEDDEKLGVFVILRKETLPKEPRALFKKKMMRLFMTAAL